MFLPTARRDGLTVRELSGETIVYDLECQKVHCLNRTAALVWKHCDGKMTVAQLAVMLRVDESVVHLALEQLGRRHLLQEPMSGLSETARRSRRDVLKQLVVAAVALPAVLTIATKASAQVGPSVPPPPKRPPPKPECTQASDCPKVACSTTACVSGSCVSTPSAALNGTGCTGASGATGICCNGVCCPPRNGCEGGKCCGELTASCKTDADCCPGLSCGSGTCGTI